MRRRDSRRKSSCCGLIAAGILGACLAGHKEMLLARGGASTDQPADETRAFVRLLENRYHSATTWKAIFLERYSEGPHDIRLESGTAYFRRPGRMRWEYEVPEKKLFVADGKTVWFYVPSDKTVTRAAMKESSDWRTPLALLTGRVRLEQLCGRIEAVAAGAKGEAAGEKDVVTLRCLPRPARADHRDSRKRSEAEEGIELAEPFDQVLLSIERARGDLDDVVIRQPGGVQMEYRFGNWQRDFPLPDAMFHFQVPRGVAIVEEAPAGNPGPQ